MLNPADIYLVFDADVRFQTVLLATFDRDAAVALYNTNPTDYRIIQPSGRDYPNTIRH